jgi:4-alpha-glucanotransferase
MKILQFAFGGEGGHEFLPHNYPRHCLVYTGTHDNDTVRGWWTKARPHERAFAGSYLACHDHDVHWAMIRAAWNSVADIAICQFQDVLGLGSEHRMNTPGTLGPQNWSWRFGWPMVGSEPARVLRLMTEVSGRLPGQAQPAPPSTAGYWTDAAEPPEAGLAVAMGAGVQ